MSADFADGDPGSRFVAAKVCSPAREWYAVIADKGSAPRRKVNRQRMSFSTTNCC